MAGDRLSRGERRDLAAAVAEVESTTGLQVVLYVGDADDPGARADELLSSSGVAGRPAVLVLVARRQRSVEVRTDPVARTRVPDASAEAAVGAMTPLLAAGRLVDGVRAGLDVLVQAAGPGTAQGADLPDLLSD